MTRLLNSIWEAYQNRYMYKYKAACVINVKVRFDGAEVYDGYVCELN